ncbi:hypothetical protein CRG98_039401 [Punica granatum]|uniref:Uncharacterized protein n=1 Tax=Punica granatum TaxID=22663 RepID=A0A2I0I881_PUNGR|nr:hypothetical protein CRG98_039401 [Punica granatum]
MKKSHVLSQGRTLSLSEQPHTEEQRRPYHPRSLATTTAVASLSPDLLHWPQLTRLDLTTSAYPLQSGVAETGLTSNLASSLARSLVYIARDYQAILGLSTDMTWSTAFSGPPDWSPAWCLPQLAGLVDSPLQPWI